MRQHAMDSIRDDPVEQVRAGQLDGVTCGEATAYSIAVYKHDRLKGDRYIVLFYVSDSYISGLELLWRRTLLSF